MLPVFPCPLTNLNGSDSSSVSSKTWLATPELQGETVVLSPNKVVVHSNAWKGMEGTKSLAVCVSRRQGSQP